MALVSIIIPFFRTNLDFVQKCAASLQGQSFKDLEILFIDDGNPSEDSSLHYIQSLIKTDARVHLLHQEHCGVSKARNLGINAAKGKYLLFVDADDWIDIDAIEKLHSQAEKNQSHIVFYNCIGEHPHCSPRYKIFNDSIDRLSQQQFHYLIQSAVNPNAIHGGIVIGVCCKMYKTTFIRESHLFFSEGISLGEDRLFLLNALAEKPQISYCSQTFYHYRYNENSLSHQYRTDFESILKTNYHTLINHKIISAVPEIKIHFQKWMSTDLLRIVLTSLQQYFFNEKNAYSQKKVIKDLQNLLNLDICKSIIANYDKKSFGKKDRLKIWCCKHRFVNLLFFFHWIQRKRHAHQH